MGRMADQRLNLGTRVKFINGQQHGQIIQQKTSNREQNKHIKFSKKWPPKLQIPICKKTLTKSKLSSKQENLIRPILQRPPKNRPSQATTIPSKIDPIIQPKGEGPNLHHKKPTDPPLKPLAVAAKSLNYPSQAVPNPVRATISGKNLHRALKQS